MTILNRFLMQEVKFISVILFHFSLMITQGEYPLYPDKCTKVLSYKSTSLQIAHAKPSYQGIYKYLAYKIFK